jgi:hypothetical protein
MRAAGAARGLDDEVRAIAAAIDPVPSVVGTQPLTPEQCRHVRFVLDLVDLLAERHGFDPATLTNPRTGAPLGPALVRMRDAVAASEPAPSPGTTIPAAKPTA